MQRTYNVLLRLTLNEDDGTINPEEWDWTTLLDLAADEEVEVKEVTEHIQSLRRKT